MIEIIIFIFIALFGIITSSDDLFEGKIRNKWVLMAILFGTVLFIVDVFSFKSQNMIFPTLWDGILQYLSNIIFTLGIGIVIWHSGLWSSGDAKLFLAYAFIIPLKFYSLGYFSFFPSLSLLVNTFFPALIILSVYIVVKNSLKKHLEAIKIAFNPKLVLTILFFVFGFSWLIGLFLNFIGLPSNIFLTIIFLFITLLLARKYLRINFLLLVGIVSALRLIFAWKDILSLQFLYGILISMFLLIILRFYLFHLAYNIFAYPVYIEQLGEGMLPAEDILKKEKKIEKKKHLQISILQAMLNKVDEISIIESLPDGLTKEDIKTIQTLHSRGDIKEHTLLIYRTFPFAPFMLAGAVITLLISGSIVQYLAQII